MRGSKTMVKGPELREQELYTLIERFFFATFAALAFLSFRSLCLLGRWWPLGFGWCSGPQTLRRGSASRRLSEPWKKQANKKVLIKLPLNRYCFNSQPALAEPISALSS